MQRKSEITSIREESVLVLALNALAGPALIHWLDLIPNLVYSKHPFTAILSLFSYLQTCSCSLTGSVECVGLQSKSQMRCGL